MKNCEQVLLTLVIPPALRHQIIDVLLQLEQQGFLSMPVAGHSSDHQHLSLTEQIAGRQQRLMLQTHGTAAQLQQLLAILAEQFADAGIHHWMSPLLQAGPLQPAHSTAQSDDTS